MQDNISRAAVAVAAFSLLFSCACSKGGSTATTPPPVPPQLLTPIAERFLIDGVVDLAAVGTIHQKTINLLDTFGTGTVVKSCTLRWAAQNDDRNLYIAFDWDDDTQNAFDPNGSSGRF